MASRPAASCWSSWRARVSRDVAFHVDTTQQRAGYASEADLNVLRREYIERARGLPLHVIFNTTVHAGNVAEVPMLARFFVEQSGVVRFASFQLQADTGRGVQGARSGAISNESIAELLSQGAGTALNFDALRAGHAQCNRTAVMLVANDQAHDAFADTAFVARFMRETAGMAIERGTPLRGIAVIAARGTVAAPVGRCRLVLDIVAGLAHARQRAGRARSRAQADLFHAQLHGRQGARCASASTPACSW